MHVHTHIDTYIYTFAYNIRSSGNRGMAGMYSRGEQFGTYHTLSGVTTRWMPQSLVASLHPPPPLYFNACVDLLSQ